MLKRIYLLLISMLFLLSGCAENAVINPDEPEQSSPIFAMTPAPDGYIDDDELLSKMGMVKFSELYESKELVGANKALQELEELYKPSYLELGLTESGITVFYQAWISLNYDDSVTEERVNFKWGRYIPVENATKNFFDNGATKAYMEERNGITYAIMEWGDRETNELIAYEVGWAQYSQVFRAILPASFTLDEVLAFCDAQPVEAWELQGNAISVSIQGMETVSIIYDDANDAIIVEDDVLYRVNGGADMEKIGYRWLVDESASRYQYVLEPGEYIFQADNPIGEPGLLVKHFEAGACISEVDYHKTLQGHSLTQFSLRVTPNPANNSLTPE